MREDLRQKVMSGKHTKEARFVEYADLDLEDRIWSNQREHMKMRRAHRIPLSGQLQVALENMRLLTGEKAHVCARSRNKLGVIDENSARLVFQRFDNGITGHGIRTTFRTWARKQGKYTHDVMENALSHEKAALVAAYMRDDLLEERRVLIRDWADYVTESEMPAWLVDFI